MAAHSSGALDRPLPYPAELSVSWARDDALVLGTFQRSASLATHDGGGPYDEPAGSGFLVLRRGSGGPEVMVGPKTTHVALSLAHPGALTPCDERRIVNRSVRPLLRALTKTGTLAHFFGRDWVSVAHRPAAWVGFAHDATSRRTLFEAFIAVSTPFAPSPRTSFLGKVPATLESASGRLADPERLANAIVEAFIEAYDLERVDVAALPEAESLPADARENDPPWAATKEEAIGWVGAGPDVHGVFRVGGDLLVSRDALARLELRAANAREDELGPIVDETVGAPGVALDGVRSLISLRDVIAEARARR